MVHTRSLCFHIDRLGKYSFRSGNSLADSAPFWLFSLQRAVLSFAGWRWWSWWGRRKGDRTLYHQFNISPFPRKIPSFLKNAVTTCDARVQFCVLLRR